MKMYCDSCEEVREDEDIRGGNCFKCGEPLVQTPTNKKEITMFGIVGKTSNANKYQKDMGWSDTNYIAHIEAALMDACDRISDGPQTYGEAKTKEDWFDHFIRESKLDPDTEEMICATK